MDYIAVHILPYWEGLPGDVAVDHAMQVYRKLREAYPGKHIVIAEFGWPSAGLNRKDAVPGKLIQAEIIRDFITRADAMGIDYSIVEAFDQPWKTSEGSVGPYWGLFNAARQPKFALTGPVETPNLVRNLITAIAIGFLLSLAIFADSQSDVDPSEYPCGDGSGYRRLVRGPHRLLGQPLLRAGCTDSLVYGRSPVGAAGCHHEASDRRNGRDPLWRETVSIA